MGYCDYMLRKFKNRVSFEVISTVYKLYISFLDIRNCMFLARLVHNLMKSVVIMADFQSFIFLLNVMA